MEEEKSVGFVVLISKEAAEEAFIYMVVFDHAFITRIRKDRKRESV